MFEKKVIAIASDHAGYDLRNKLIRWLEKKLDNSIQVIDIGCVDNQSVDYPLYASEACKEILSGRATHGILICGTGVGMCMSANKFFGIRAVVGTDVGVVKLSREHNNANVLCLGARVSPSDFQVKVMIDVFLNTEFSHNNRHVRRVDQMDNMDSTYRDSFKSDRNLSDESA